MSPGFAPVSAILLVAVIAPTTTTAFGSIRGAENRERRESCWDDEDKT